MRVLLLCKSVTLLLLVTFQGLCVLVRADKKISKSEETCINENPDKEATPTPAISPIKFECEDDDPELCSLRASKDDCDTDPSWMLIHCRKSCVVCLQEQGQGDEFSSKDIEQDVGFGKIPATVSIQILQTIRLTNLYYYQNTILVDDPPYYEYALVQRYGTGSCSDRKPLCAFWKLQGQCTHDEYAEYTQDHCPRSCRICDKQHTHVSKGRAFLQFLMGDLRRAYDHPAEEEEKETTTHTRNVVADRHRTLSLLMTTLGMDPNLLGKQSLHPNDGNWALELHRRLISVIPAALLKLYATTTSEGGSTEILMSDEDYQVLIQVHGWKQHQDMDPSIVLENILVSYRDRGSIVALMRDFDHFVTRPIQLGIGFSVPNDQAIQRLQDVQSPIVHMGAGAGYWTAILKHAGVEIIAYDINPPIMDDENEFFDVSYTNDIEKGACTDVFVDQKGSQLAQTHSLLLIWPNDPDPVDNPQFCVGQEGDLNAGGSSQPVWDVDCLLAYYTAGGSRVVYIGERQDKIQQLMSTHAAPDCGISSTRRFQDLLKENFTLVDTVDLPNWWLNVDDMTIWERK